MKKDVKIISNLSIKCNIINLKFKEFLHEKTKTSN